MLKLFTLKEKKNCQSFFKLFSDQADNELTQIYVLPQRGSKVVAPPCLILNLV